LQPPFVRDAWSGGSAGQAVGGLRGSVLDAVASRVAAGPDEIAVTGPHGTLVYRELWDRAGELADSIVSATGGRPEAVAYSGPRSIMFPIAVLGVFRARACFVSTPLDWPDARRRDVLRDAACRVTVGEDLRLLVGPSAGADQASQSPAGLRVDDADLAYLVFTSGSTGRPKGVIVSHGAFANNCFGSIYRYEITAVDRVLQFTGLGVDIALEELFIAWLAGGAVVLAPHDLALSISEFSEYVAQWRVSVLDLPVSYMLLWITAIERGSVPPPPRCLRVVAIGSEPVPPDTFRRWFAVTSDVAIATAYGSTEQAITSVIDGPRSHGDTAPAGAIGTPIPNVTAYVLDDELRPVADGETGELHVGGRAVATGYLGEPGLTAERFLPDPFSASPGDRMYASRDRARRLADGSLEVLGRMDQCIIVAGHTVDPLEIERLIESVAGVEQVTVELDESRLGGLVAHILPSADSAACRSRLSDRITEDLTRSLPSSIRPRLEILLSNSGSGSGGADELDAVQRELYALWSSGLGGQELDVRDNFFDLGGNSLIAIQMLARTREVLGVDISFRDFMTAQTLDAFSRLVVDERARKA
jgi:amino acid adenylation domain-containing protein